MSSVLKTETLPNNHSFGFFSSINSSITKSVNDNSNDRGNTDTAGASDYILIAMIVAMMICMAVCCICLFCRSSSQFSICGYNCDVNDRNASIANDESELHEVVPLTPAITETHNLPDIESKLKSDPPPPQYSEVAGSSVLDRFKWRSKKKSNFNDSGNIENTNPSSKVIETAISRGKRSEKKKRSSKTFHRSSANQTSSAVSNPKTSAKQLDDLNRISELQSHKSEFIVSNESCKKLAVTKSDKCASQDVCSSMKRAPDTCHEGKEHKGEVYDDEVFM